MGVHVFDVRDSVAVHAWFQAIDSAAPVDLLIANAGIFDGHGPQGVLETAAEVRHLVEVNLIGVIGTVQAALEPMRRRRRGRIAIERRRISGRSWSSPRVGDG